MTTAPIRTKQAFAELSRRGTRRQSGPIWVLHAPGPEDGDVVEVAFALPRRVGSAVVRNRLRRRLRELMRTRGRAGALAAGAYLVGASSPAAADLEFSLLGGHLERALEPKR